MEEPSVLSSKVEPPESEPSKKSSTESLKKVQKTAKPNASVTTKVSATTGTNKKKMEVKSSSSSTTPTSRPVAFGSSVSRGSSSVTSIRRNSTGGVVDKQPVPITKPKKTEMSSEAGKKSRTLGSEPLRRSLPEVRRSSLPSVPLKSATSVAKTSRMSPSSDLSKQDSVKKPAVKAPSSISSSTRALSTSMDSTGSSKSRKVVQKLSTSSPRTPSTSNGSSGRPLFPSADRNSSLSGRRKVASTESRDARLFMLPQVDSKANDDVRLDLRGHRIRSLNSSGLSLSTSLEFLYLRDNLLSTLEGVEILKRVKVLDLSFNDFKGPGFEPLENCQALQQLYLAGNQITSLASLPELPNLEFLSVAQNKLKSLSMASQPRLQVLAASKNRIATLKGFPLLPSLEHLRMEENPILQMPHLQAAAILLVGPTLKKFNDRDLSREELAYAKRYPAHTALCIRGGWELSRPDQALDSTFRFLFDQWKDQFPPGYLLEEASIDRPFEGDTCSCHFNFTLDKHLSSESDLVLKYQWFIGERTPSKFTVVPDAVGEVYWPKHSDIGKVLKVECTPVLEGTEYPPIFAISSPVSPGTKCPKVVKIEVHGELIEGNVVKGYAEVAWCGGTPGKSVASWLRRKWNSSPVVIGGAEDEEYQLNLDDVDSCLVFMYTPVAEEGVKGEPQYAITDYIKPAPPSVNNVQIIGDLVEGNTIKGVGNYFGGREGPSKFEWSSENKKSGDLVLLTTGTIDYTISKEDVGHRLTFAYIPINFEGQEGKTVMVYSQIVKQAPPKVANVKIVGDIREGSKVTVTGTVTGGTEGSSRVQWFKTSSSIFEGENGMEALSTSKIAKAFRIPLGAVGLFIVAKYTPMTLDGESGEPSYAISDRAVETLPPSLNFLSITGDYCEDGILTASYGYIGGHEGKSVYSWSIHAAATDTGSIIHEMLGLLQFRVTKDAIGKFISFTCTPIRDDGFVGESKSCMSQERVRPGSPRLLSLQLAGNAVEGSVLNVDKKYWGGDEGESVFRWFRTSSDGTQSELKDVTGSSYTLSLEDIGFLISVSCEPVRSDWARGPIVLSEQIGPIIPGPPTCRSLELLGLFVEGERLSFSATYTGGEKGTCLYEWFRVKSSGAEDKLDAGEFLDLSLEDVGRSIQIVYTPVRKDGNRGKSESVVSDVVVPGNPKGVELVIPDCCENGMVIPKKTYFGGLEGDGEYTWYRTNHKFQGSAILEISDICDVFICGNTETYTPSVEDVGAYLALRWLPTRADGKNGEPLISISNSPVSPALPSVSNVHVKMTSLGNYLGEGEYFGGYEGSSLFSWYRKTKDGDTIPISDANSKVYQVTDADYNCCLLFGYTPVRSDSVVGELKLSEPTDIILPELPIIEMLALTGKAVEGDVLTAIEVIPKSESQQHVWNKYKKEVRYQWFSSSEPENDMVFKPLPSKRSCSYKLRLEDIGCCLRCECIITDVFGRSSQSAYAESTPVLPGIPRIEKLEIEGRGFHTNLYAVRGVYSGGKEGKSRIQWLRSMVGSPDLISIPGETGRMYEANVDDVGYRLVVIYTPVREDGVEGQPVSASTDPIAVEPDILKEVKQNLDLGSVKFEVLFDKDKTPKKTPGMGSLERRILEVNRKRIKVVKPGSKTSFPTTEIRGTYAPPFHVELFRNDQHRIRIVVDSEHEVDLLVQTRHTRDIIVLVIRGLAQRFNSTSLNSLLKIGT